MWQTKKLLAIVLCVSISISIIGCGKEDLKTFSVTEDGIITVAGGTMKLGDYTGITLTKQVQQATEEEVEAEAKDYFYDYMDPIEITDRGISNGDTVTLSFTMACGYDQTDYEDETIVIGENPFGSDFDEKLFNTQKGEVLTFSVTYPSDYEESSYAGKTYSFSNVVIQKIEAEYAGEITDALVKEYFDINTKEEFYNEIRSALNSNYELIATDNLYADAYQTIQENSEFFSYSKTLWTENYNEIVSNYSSYMSFFGCDNIEDVYSLFGVSDETIKTAATSNLYNYMITNAIANIEGITASKEEIDKLETEYMDAYGYETKEELFSAFKEELFSYWVIADKVSQYIIENAKIETIYTTEEQ